MIFFSVFFLYYKMIFLAYSSVMVPTSSNIGMNNANLNDLKFMPNTHGDTLKSEYTDFRIGTSVIDGERVKKILDSTLDQYNDKNFVQGNNKNILKKIKNQPFYSNNINKRIVRSMKNDYLNLDDNEKLEVNQKENNFPTKYESIKFKDDQKYTKIDINKTKKNFLLNKSNSNKEQIQNAPSISLSDSIIKDLQIDSKKFIKNLNLINQANLLFPNETNPYNPEFVKKLQRNMMPSNNIYDMKSEIQENIDKILRKKRSENSYEKPRTKQSSLKLSKINEIKGADFFDNGEDFKSKKALVKDLAKRELKSEPYTAVDQKTYDRYMYNYDSNSNNNEKKYVDMYGNNNNLGYPSQSEFDYNDQRAGNIPNYGTYGVQNYPVQPDCRNFYHCKPCVITKCNGNQVLMQAKQCYKVNDKLVYGPEWNVSPYNN